MVVVVGVGGMVEGQAKLGQVLSLKFQRERVAVPIVRGWEFATIAKTDR